MQVNSIDMNEVNNILSSLGKGYKMLSSIGLGGQKEVYKIENCNHEIQIFKIIKPTPDSLERIKREIRASEIIDDEHIPKILFTNADKADNPNIIWIIEEYVEGNNLRECLKDGRKFTVADIILFLDTMFSILEKSESKHIIHRDIKPENILLDKTGKYWLIDFGIARHLDLDSLTDSNSPFGPGTWGYSASEQFRNRKHDIDIRADLFSVGVVAEEMILGYNPYTDKVNNVIAVIKRIEQVPLPLLRIDGDTRFLLAQFLRLLGDNRIFRRPSSVKEAKDIFAVIKPTLAI
ncbi:MAG: serine/threonine protein kinase [Spirochaetaceae bacterium]|nr:serine/threonine protein kinase [Spirochaetaceae bacterium]